VPFETQLQSILYFCSSWTSWLFCVTRTFEISLKLYVRPGSFGLFFECCANPL